MRESYSYELRKFIRGELTLNVDGASIPVHDMVPDSATPPYVVFDSITEVASDSMDSYGSSFEVTMQIITHYFGNTGGRKLNDMILKQIVSQLSTSESRQTDDFWLVSAKFTNKNDFIELSTYKRVRTIITFNYLIH